MVAIDPELADTAAMSEAYDLPLDTGANCVVVAGKRDGQERVAACVVRADTRADVNNLVKRTLDVRKASFLSMDRAVEESAMEYGGITPVGLPAEWRLLLDRRVVEIDVAVIGSGVRRSKLLRARPAARRAARRRGDRRPGRAARQLGTPTSGRRVHPPATRKPASRRTRRVSVRSTTTPPEGGPTCRSRFATSRAGSGPAGVPAGHEPHRPSRPRTTYPTGRRRSSTAAAARRCPRAARTSRRPTLPRVHRQGARERVAPPTAARPRPSVSTASGTSCSRSCGSCRPGPS